MLDMGPMAIAEPLAPQTVQETHVPKGLLEELALKLLVLEGGLNVLDLAERICLSLPITEELCQGLRKEHLCEVKGTLGRYYWLAPTDKGRAQASELFSRNQYAGPAPVTLTEYDIRVHSQSIQQAKVTPVDLARALHGLVLDPETVTRLGTAAVSGSSTLPVWSFGHGKNVGCHAASPNLPRLGLDTVRRRSGRSDYHGARFGRTPQDDVSKSWRER